MKRVFYLLFCTMILCSCNEPVSRKEEEPYNESRELVPNPEGYKKDNVIVAEPDTAKTKSDCHLNEYLNDPKIPELAKTIFNREDWNLNDFTVLNFLDSLSAKDKGSRAFYFRVVTNSREKSDGYYSEGLGNKGKIYVENNTIEFLNYFVDNPCFTEKDLNTWVDVVMLEFSIIAENPGDKYLVDNYVKALNANCTSCNQKQRRVLDTFCKSLLRKWTSGIEKQNQK